MTRLLYLFVEYIARIHDKLMLINDTHQMYFSDKQLHFIFIGIVGMMILLFIYPLFIALSKHHVLVIAWIYVFTVMVVLTFAIEIGQGYTHTGIMEMEDVVAGLAGFMAMFMVFAAVRMVILEIKRCIERIHKKKKKEEKWED